MPVRWNSEWKIRMCEGAAEQLKCSLEELFPFICNFQIIFVSFNTLSFDA